MGHIDGIGKIFSEDGSDLWDSLEALSSTSTQFLRKTSATTIENVSASTGGGTWGSITGTLSDQIDLQAALDLKAPLDSPVNRRIICWPPNTAFH